MFWGLNLKPNRKYSQTTEKSFHISQAALDSESSQGGPIQIFISCENQRFLVCTLRKDVCEQAVLDLNFSEGNEICFQSIGSGNVTLSGYVMEDMADDFMNGDEEEEEDVESGSDAEEVEQDLRQALNAKKAKNKKAENKKAEKAKVAAKAVKAGGEEDREDDEDEEDDSDFDVENDGDDDDEDVEVEGEEDDDDDDDDDEEDEDEEEDDDSEDEEVQQPKAKQPKLEPKSEKQQNGMVKQKENQQADKKSKKDKKKEQQQQQQQPKQQQQEKQQKPGGERVLSGGVKIVDLRVGGGPEVKPGKRAQVYYEGRLSSNNKVFDSMKSGAGFKFSVGRGEVIKGWDVGVVGMKVGGKRRITCPPHMAYGSRGSPPTIPPNSTLVFEVELKGSN